MIDLHQFYRISSPSTHDDDPNLDLDLDLGLDLDLDLDHDLDLDLLEIFYSLVPVFLIFTKFSGNLILVPRTMPMT